MMGRLMDSLKEVGWLLLVVLLCPLAIVAIGAPVALLVRLLLEIVGGV